MDWQIIDPSDPAQDSMFSVTFDGNISSEISPYVIAKHGAFERIALSGGKAAVFHDLDTELSAISPNPFDYGTWKHFAVTVDSELGQMRIFEDGNQTQSVAFTPGETAKSVVGQDWYFGQGLISSSFDELRLSKSPRSADWVAASYQNQKPNASLPSISVVTGPPSFTSVSKFSLSADQLFSHSIGYRHPSCLYCRWVAERNFAQYDRWYFVRCSFCLRSIHLHNQCTVSEW